MIKVYTDFKHLPKDRDWVFYNDAFFNTHISIKKLDERDWFLLNQIEGIKPADTENNLVKSRTGVIRLQDISTGMKTLLNIRYIKRHKLNLGVDVTECGENVLDFLFDEVSDGTIPILLRHSHMFEVKDHYFLVNNTTQIRTIRKLRHIIQFGY